MNVCRLVGRGSKQWGKSARKHQMFLRARRNMDSNTDSNQAFMQRLKEKKIQEREHQLNLDKMEDAINSLHANTVESLSRIAELSETEPVLVENIAAKLSPKAQQELILLVRSEMCPDGVDGIPRPRPIQLKRLAVWYGLPMVGFGFCDNVIMILAGDYMDSTLCVSLGTSTLFAAALGNIVSDVGGVGLGGVIEDLGNKFGMKHHGLTHPQLSLKISLVTKYVGIALGVTLGCVVGMFPLLIPDSWKPWVVPDDRRQKNELFGEAAPAS